MYSVRNTIITLTTLLLLFFGFSITHALATIPNLDDDSHPNRVKLNECIIDVKTVTEWDEKSTLEAAQNICDLRRLHSQQKARFLGSLDKLPTKDNPRFKEDLPQAIKDSWTIVQSCIDFKTRLTRSYNVGILATPEKIHTYCYSIAASLVESVL